METLKLLLIVFVGSGFGGVCRWAISQWLNGQHPVSTWFGGQFPVSTWFGGQFPLGTLVVNVAGCFLIGWLSRLSPGDAHLRLLLVTGFCGGFTTFSTFMNENLLMLRGHQLLLSAAYMALSLFLGLLAAWYGHTHL